MLYNASFVMHLVFPETRDIDATCWQGHPPAASKDPTITGTAMAVSFSPLLRPPPWLGVALGVPAAAACEVLTFALSPKGPPTTFREAAASVTFDG